MNILIVGAGVVGSNLAEELSVSGHNVSVVDRDPAVIRFDEIPRQRVGKGLLRTTRLCGWGGHFARTLPKSASELNVLDECPGADPHV